MKKFYSYATGKSGESLGLNYNEYGIISFPDEDKARLELESILRLNPALEGKIINLTTLVQKKIIPQINLQL